MLDVLLLLSAKRFLHISKTRPSFSLSTLVSNHHSALTGYRGFSPDTPMRRLRLSSIWILFRMDQMIWPSRSDILASSQPKPETSCLPLSVSEKHICRRSFSPTHLCTKPFDSMERSTFDMFDEVMPSMSPNWPEVRVLDSLSEHSAMPSFRQMPNFCSNPIS